jgi:hypothetical protein
MLRLCGDMCRFCGDKNHDLGLHITNHQLTDPICTDMKLQKTEARPRINLANHDFMLLGRQHRVIY